MWEGAPALPVSSLLESVWSFLEDALLSLLADGATSGWVWELGARTCAWCAGGRKSTWGAGSLRGAQNQEWEERGNRSVKNRVMGTASSRRGAETPSARLQMTGGEGSQEVTGPGEDQGDAGKWGGLCRDEVWLVWLRYLTSSSRKHGCWAPPHRRAGSELRPPQPALKIKSVIWMTVCALGKKPASGQAPLAGHLPITLPVVSKLVVILFFLTFSHAFIHTCTCMSTGILP